MTVQHTQAGCDLNQSQILRYWHTSVLLFHPCFLQLIFWKGLGIESLSSPTLPSLSQALSYYLSHVLSSNFLPVYQSSTGIWRMSLLFSKKSQRASFSSVWTSLFFTIFRTCTVLRLYDMMRTYRCYDSYNTDQLFFCKCLKIIHNFFRKWLVSIISENPEWNWGPDLLINALLSCERICVIGLWCCSNGGNKWQES